MQEQMMGNRQSNMTGEDDEDYFDDDFDDDFA